MTMISNLPGYPPAPRSNQSRLQYRRPFGTLLMACLRRLIDRLVAAALARYERHAASVVLRHLSDRELKDIGLFRFQIGKGLDEAAKMRERWQRGGR